MANIVPTAVSQDNAAEIEHDPQTLPIMTARP